MERIFKHFDIIKLNSTCMFLVNTLLYKKRDKWGVTLMKSTGIVRKLDELGRIVLPKELRKTMNIEGRDPLEIHVEKNSIIITKYDNLLGKSGIVRKVDELGRVVLPKELRKTLKLQTNEPLEVFIEKQRIILKQFYSDKTCMITGVIDDKNFIFENGRIVLSKDGANILIQELHKYIAQ